MDKPIKNCILYVSYTYVAKNKLLDEAGKFIIDNQGQAFESVADLKAFIKKEIERLNAKHKRCKPIQFSTFSYNEGVHSLTGISSVSAIIIEFEPLIINYHA